MARLIRFGSAFSALALASVIAGCATPAGRQGQVASFDKTEVGLAMRAQLALAGGQFETAIGLAERAVEANPDSAAMRALLGNVYFGSGRFASAEAAYNDTLTLQSNAPKIVLKLALVQIAQGKRGEAVAFLDAARNVLDPSDLGLALALAGQPAEALMVLEPAARMPNADAQLRQNLAFAYGLAGDWTAARTVAAQDLPADQVDLRVRKWMALATPVRHSDQVAALVGVTPAASDPGQPVRLALRDSGERLARLVQPRQPAEAAPAPATTAYAVPEMTPAPEPVMASFAPPAAEAPVEAVVDYQPQTLAAAYEAPVVEEVVAAAAVVPEAAQPAPPPLVAALAADTSPKPRKAAKPRSGKAGVVVQLGAYSSRASISVAWDRFTAEYGSLRQYTPTSARYDGAEGTVYRLAVKGFDSFGEASSLCSSLKAKGKSCFVRRAAGDTPVQFASR